MERRRHGAQAARGWSNNRAMINPGESTILAASSIMPAPIAVGDGIRPRQPAH
jgi:pyruvate/2-oxoglutarate dehydrogenase complex dihydrolipoamide acyltransferase (E2) component